MYDAYRAFTRATPLDAPLGILEEFELHKDPNARDTIMAKREKLQREAFDKLAFGKEVEARKPFVESGVYREIERFLELGTKVWLRQSAPALFSNPEDNYTDEMLVAQLDVISNAIKTRLAVVELTLNS
jgi:hypothetical protein